MKKNKKIVIEGVLRRNSKGFGFVKVEGKEEEYHISEKNMKNALDGETVQIKVIEKSNNSDLQDEAKIIKIISHKKDTVVGTYQNSKNFGFVVPDDSSFGTDIFISKKNKNKAKNNQKVLVKITKYPEKNKNAEGKIIEVIGNIDQAGVDMLCLVKEYNLPYEFPIPVLEEAKAIKQEIDKEDIKNRLDLRKEEMFTIDGDDSKDLDDAVSVKKLKNGNYELGVHIADVSHYVKDGSKLDKEAITRGTSIYMLDRVIPMLPKELSNGICSLNAGQDRFAISAIMEINKEGNVVKSKIAKSVINVNERMTYNNVRIILESRNKKKKDNEFIENTIKDIEGTERIETSKIYNKDDLKNIKNENIEIKKAQLQNINEKDLKKKEQYEKEVLNKYKKYIGHFKRMEDLAKILKARREKNGYLSLDIPESKIVLNKDGIAIDVKKYETSFANEIIEQFMLTANEVVAETFSSLKAPFVYRVHEVPDMDKVKDLNKFLFNLGYKIKTNKDTVEPIAFEEVLKQIKGKPEEKVISTLILRTLKVARYEPENKGHFGIASKCYCHFTSPIRRYPDLFIHRVISEYLKNNNNKIESKYNAKKTRETVKVDENSKLKDDVQKDTVLIKTKLPENLYEKYVGQAEKYAEQSSECEKIAQKVERDAEDIKKAEYMQNKIGEEYDGIISSITSFGVFVELENTVEGLIRFENLGNEYFIYDEDNKTLIGEKTKKMYHIGDKIKIRVISADKQTRRIDFENLEIGDRSKLPDLGN